MAWQARVESISAASPQQVAVQVTYYDDAILSGDGTTPQPQFFETFVFPTNTAPATMQAAVIARGQDARRSFQRVATLLSVAPPGTIVPIP